MFEIDEGEKELQERDERVENTLLNKIEVLEYEMQEMKERISELKKIKDMIYEATRKEQWYKLEGILSKDDIESLCCISPGNLLGE